ncbi:hypothetical protein ABK040_005855 [Willaertia magna]
MSLEENKNNNAEIKTTTINSAENTLSESSILFSKELLDIINVSDLNQIQSIQKQVLTQVRQTNVNLFQINQNLSNQMSGLHKNLQVHQYMLKEMKTDLDFITRTLKEIRKNCKIPEPPPTNLDLDDEVLTYNEHD